MSVSGAAATSPSGVCGAVIHGLGGCLRVVSEDPDSEQQMATLQHQWTRCLRPEPRDREAPVISLGATPDNEPAFWERTTQRITAELIGQQAGKLLMLHAGGVCNPETGASIVYVAPSRTGKTTLTLSLSGRFGYLSDETIALDERLRIFGYPKPLSVRSTDGQPRREMSPDELGFAPAHPEPFLARLVILNRSDTHHGAPVITPLDLFDAAVVLAPQTSSLSALDDGLHRLQSLTRQTGPVLQVAYRDAPELHGLFETVLGMPLWVRRVEAADVLTRSEPQPEVLLLLDDHLVRVGELGTAVLDETAEPIEIAALAQRLAARFGAPEQGDIQLRTRAAVDELLTQGALTKVAQA